MKKIFLALLPCCLLLFTFQAGAEVLPWPTPYHSVVLMSADAVTKFGDDPAQYEGVEFPLFCGIASVYPEENRFVFTKMTDLPISGVEAALRQVERDRYVETPHGLRTHVEQGLFPRFFLGYSNSKNFFTYPACYGWDIPESVTPHFTRTCRYTAVNDPPTDCAYSVWDLYSILVPFTEVERGQMAREAAKANRPYHDAPLHLAILMPAKAIERFGDDPAQYEGVEFPLYCGIVSIYPKENRFVFTKKTDLPILGLEHTLRQIEQSAYITVRDSSGSPPRHVQPGHQDFTPAFLSLAFVIDFRAHRISHAQEIPVDYAPHFTQTCRYSTAKTPPTDCAYESWDLEDVYIPIAYEEVRATIEQSE